MIRDNNSQQKFEQDEHEQWYEHDRKLLDGFDILRPVIRGEKKYQDVVEDFERIFTESKGK